MTSDVEYEVDMGIRLPVPYLDVVDILTADPAAIISSAVSAAFAGARHSWSVEADWLQEGPEQSRLQMRWYAVGRPVLPAVAADLVVIRRPWAGTEVRLAARYSVPFGGLGVIDRAAFRRTAEQMTQIFLEAVGRGITAQIDRDSTHSEHNAVMGIRRSRG